LNSRNGAIVAVAVVLVIIIAFIPIIPIVKSQAVTYTSPVLVPVPYVTTSPTNVSYIITEVSTEASPVYSTSTISQQVVSTATSQVFSLSAQTINHGTYVYSEATLTAGMDVQVSFTASDTEDLYVMNSAQFSDYSNSGTVNTEAIISDSSGGTTSFAVSATDTYYLIIHNGHDGVLGIGSENVGLQYATGTATYQQVNEVYSTVVNTNVVYNTVTTTLTAYSSTYVNVTSTSTVTSTATLTSTTSTNENVGLIQALLGG